MNMYYPHIHRPYNSLLIQYVAENIFREVMYWLCTICIFTSFFLNAYWGTKVLDLLIKGETMEEPSSDE